jgi:hypothetical protein
MGQTSAGLPFRRETFRRLVGLAFEGPAKKIYEELSALQLSSNSEELWEFLRTRLYNHSQQRNQRAAFYNSYWKDRHESVEQFGAMLQAMAIEMLEKISDDALVHRFIEGIHSRLRVQALLVHGNFDEVVAKTSLVPKIRLLRSPVPRVTQYLQYRNLKRNLERVEALELGMVEIRSKETVRTVIGFVLTVRNWVIFSETALRRTGTWEILGLLETGKGLRWRQIRDPLKFSRREYRSMRRTHK